MDFGPLPADLTQAETLADKRVRAIAYLGDNWMMHPKYQFRPRHAFNAATSAPHSVLRPIQLAAQQAGRI